MGIYDLKVISSKQLTANVFMLTLRKNEELKPLPGQFLHVKCGTGLEKYLRRPISVCNVSGSELKLAIEIKGEGTKILSQLRAGEMVNVLGPLGKGFTTENIEGKHIIIAGGGLGCAPLLYLLTEAKKKSCKVTAFMGFKSKENIILLDEYMDLADTICLCTDDGSYANAGYIIPHVRSYIESFAAEDIPVDAVYTCGPQIMMDKVVDIAKEFKLPYELSLEERMGCGIGACLVCACDASKYSAEEKDDSKTEAYKHVCKDGPVFGNI